MRTGRTAGRCETATTPKAIRMPRLSQHPDLVLFNAKVISIDESRPTAELVAIEGDRIVWVGSKDDLTGLRSASIRLIDCRGQTLLPGFIDAHCHIMAYASSLLAVDCSPSAATSIDGIKEALRERALNEMPGRWVRGTGYDEFRLKEKRHPSRKDLDDAVPSHPVRLDHRSGHACVLNSTALACVGISTQTPEPPGGTIVRDWETGEPTGLLMEMDAYLEGLIPRLTDEELRRGARLASQRLVSVGVTSVQDATHSNTPQRWEAFERLKADGTLRPRVTMMVGSDHLEAFLDRRQGFDWGRGDPSLGAVKIMLSMTTGSLRPSYEELLDRVIRAHEAGFPVAVHAVEAEAVSAAARVLTRPRARDTGVPPKARWRDRIEHCSESPPAVMATLAGSGVVVVTQPAFLYHSGRRYLSEVANEMLPWLYPLSRFSKEGLMPAASSDAPVVHPSPLVGVYAAATRHAETGETVGDESERVSVLDALRMYTLNGAHAAYQEEDRGSIEVGKVADLVLLDKDPTRAGLERLLDIKVPLTIIGGQVAWEA